MNPPYMNQAYKHLRALLSVLLGGGQEIDRMIFEAMEQAGTPVTKSKLQGWRVGRDSRLYQRMRPEELTDVVGALVKYFERQQ